MPLNLLAQRTGTLELYMWTSGFYPETEVDFYLNACGPIWDEDKEITTSATLLNSLVNIPEYLGGNNYTSHGNDYDNGWDFVTSTDTPPSPVFAWGLYKVYTYHGDSSYFYLDFRDHRWPEYETPHYGHSTDMWLRYYEDEEEFEYSSHGSFDTLWTTISDGEYLTLWGIKQKGTPSVGNFEDYWFHSLNMTVAGNDHPRIVWGPHPTFSPLSGYKIYRATTYGDEPPPDPGDFSLETTLNSSTYIYEDPDIVVDEDGSNITWYYVKAYYEHPKTHTITYSSATDTVHTDSVEFYKPIVKGKSIKSNYIPKLHQNYPNPFNPTTTISFDLAKESTVHLQIFDIRGKVILTLINKKMDKGTHFVKFNSNGLPSGIYFYRLQTEEFTDIKRMLLLK
jgi:hypothetical protein